MRHGMTMIEPATRWQDAIPCGNGTLGALVFGGIAREATIVNHEALWGWSEKRTLPDVSDAVPELRRLLAEGRWKEAESFLSDRLVERGYPARRNAPYHPAFDVVVEQPTRAAFADYRRALDFATGEATVSWSDAGHAFRRRLFVSRADDAIVLEISGDAPFAATIALDPHEPKHPACGVDFATSAGGDGWLAIKGRYRDAPADDPAAGYGGVARVTARGGRMEARDGRTVLTDVDSALVVIKLFVREPVDNASARLRDEIAAFPAEYGALFDRHAVLHRELFLRAELDLFVPDAERDRANERLLLDAYSGDVSTALIERMAAYGRYLLMASSRPGGWPANLQGVWNGDWNPPWESDYHNDENIQMNYWQAHPGNMPEVALPFFDYYDRMLADYRENARKIYGCRGILAPIAQTTDGLMYLGGWVNWTAGAGWLAQLYWDRWLFTGDRDFLRDRAVPFLREVVRFYEDFLVEGDDGRLIFAPSLSPENIPPIHGASHVQMNATMDVAVAREVLGNLVAACETLDIDGDSIPRWREMREILPPYAANEDGAIREWLHPAFPDNYRHRHLSHIYPVFPGVEVTEESDRATFAACRTAVEKRLVVGLAAQSGWSYAHMANIRARLGEGNRALESLELVCRSVTGHNLFTYHNDWRQQGLTVSWFGAIPPFQIDANLGFSAAVLEMLVQGVPGMVKLLPALPDPWIRGRATGLRCRGGITVDIFWDRREKFFMVRLTSDADRTIEVKFPRKTDILSVRVDVAAESHGTAADERVRASKRGLAYRDVRLPAGRTVEIHADVRKWRR